jgi:phytoene desaturase
MPKAIVIGGGFGGMAAALRLRKRGYDVTLLEKGNQLGGRARVFKRNGYTFDAGPTVITAPFLFDELWQLFGKRREDYVTFVPLDPWYRIQFADGSTFDYGGSIEQTLAEIRKFEPADCDGYLRFLAHSKRIFDIGFTQLGDKPFDSFWSMLKCAPDLIRLGTWRTVWQMACKYIKNDKLRRVFSFQPLLVGGNPFTTTSIYSLIHYLEREYGVWFALGGTGAIVAAMKRLMEEVGIEMRFATEVTRLAWGVGVSPGLRGPDAHATVQSVSLASSERLECDSVVCNGDVPLVYDKLLSMYAKKWTRSEISNLEFSMGLFVLYFGTTRKHPDVAHHTIILGEKYEQLLREMFDEHKLEMSDFSVYLHRPTATDPSLAPPGCDGWYVLVPVPNLQSNIDWREMGPRYRDLVVKYLERVALPGLRECIVEDFYVTPKYFRDELNTMHGTGFSIQPTFRQSAYWRFHNRSEDIANLYFVGAGTHPGAGIPGVLCSAKVLEHVLPQTR